VESKYPFETLKSSEKANRCDGYFCQGGLRHHL